MIVLCRYLLRLMFYLQVSYITNPSLKCQPSPPPNPQGVQERREGDSGGDKDISDYTNPYLQ